MSKSRVIHRGCVGKYLANRPESLVSGDSGGLMGGVRQGKKNPKRTRVRDDREPRGFVFCQVVPGSYKWQKLRLKMRHGGKKERRKKLVE